MQGPDLLRNKNKKILAYYHLIFIVSTTYIFNKNIMKINYLSMKINYLC